MDELKKIIKIGTLGPSGTSSEAAAAYFIQTFKKGFENYSITLLNSFQSVLHELTHGDLSMAIVPHAYSEINLFYINYKVALYRMFTTYRRNKPHLLGLLSNMGWHLI